MLSSVVLALYRIAAYSFGATFRRHTTDYFSLLPLLSS
jgi:hypothetical protein